MKKEKRTLLAGVGTVVFVVVGALAYWLLDGNIGKTLAVILIIFGMLCCVWLVVELESQNQDGGGSSSDIGSRGMCG